MAPLPDRHHGVPVYGVKALRLAVAAAVLVATGALAASALATSRSEKNLQTVNHQVLAAVNQFRAAHGLGRLRESSALDRSARQHSLEMGRDGYFSHTSANGTAFWRRIQHYYRTGRLLVLGGGGEPPLGRAERERRAGHEDVDREP